MIPYHVPQIQIEIQVGFPAVISCHVPQIQIKMRNATFPFMGFPKI